MLEDERVDIVKGLLFEHMKSPSLRHIKDPYMVIKLAQAIVKKLDRGNSSWTKWNGLREQLAKSATACWIPLADLRDHLNRMDGPPLTLSDVEQRLLAFMEEQYSDFPRDELREGCLAVYQSERAQGTEMPAIVGVLRAHVEREEERLRQEHETWYRELKERERIAAEQRLLSGADCKWSPWKKSKDVYCRVNGRLFRISPAENKRLNLFELEDLSLDGGTLLGTYLTRTAGTKAVNQIAYRPS